MCQYAVVFSSQSGNTEKIATSIYNAIPNHSKDIVFVNDDLDDSIADILFVGFNANSGSCTEDISYFLQKVHNKNVAFFGTYGGIDLSQNYQNIISNTLSYLPKDNTFLGSFLCKAKLTISERERFETLCKKNPTNPQYQEALKYLNALMLHPDVNDEFNAQNFAISVINKLHNSM